MLAATYERQLYAFASRLSGDPDSAEDLVQEALIRAWSSLKRFDPERDFRGWLFGIAAHVCTDRLRRRGRRKEAPASEALPEVADPDPASDPPRAVERRELAEEVAAALRQLSPAYRTVLLLRFQHGMTFREIGAALKTNPKAVEIRIRRAKAKLRPLLEPLFPELTANEAIDESEGREGRTRDLRSVGL
jgi:RNA polymerase sigma-70 factor (ECF subfamily)